MTDSSFGPVANPRQWKFGQCIACFDEAAHRKGGIVFGGNYRRTGRVCGHRLPEFKRVIPQFRLNRQRIEDGGAHAAHD